jgi:Fic family protein
MELLKDIYLKEYLDEVTPKIENIIKSYLICDKDFDLGYRNKASAIFSSNIEGNTLDLNSYMNLKQIKEKIYKKKEISEIDDLIEAYQFVQGNLLNEQNLLKAHQILSRNILIKSKQGKYREEPVGVYSSSGLVYLAIEPQYVSNKMNSLFIDINELMNKKLTIYEVLYFSAMIHLVFVHIHPFFDGNGRSARLLEKWFLTSKLGKEYWNLLSEKYYKEHINDYYEKINLGINYYELDYSKCVPFLLLLPKSFIE